MIRKFSFPGTLSLQDIEQQIFGNEVKFGFRFISFSSDPGTQQNHCEAIVHDEGMPQRIMFSEIAQGLTEAETEKAFLVLGRQKVFTADLFVQGTKKTIMGFAPPDPKTKQNERAKLLEELQKGVVLTAIAGTSKFSTPSTLTLEQLESALGNTEELGKLKITSFHFDAAKEENIFESVPGEPPSELILTDITDPAALSSMQTLLKDLGVDESQMIKAELSIEDDVRRILGFRAAAIDPVDDHAPRPLPGTINFDSAKKTFHGKDARRLSAFLPELVTWANTAPVDIFAKNNNSDDIYARVKPFLGPFEDNEHRRAIMLEVLRVLGGIESDWKWTEGADGSAGSNRELNEIETGLFQVSSNSMAHGRDLRALVVRRVGSDKDSKFIEAMKADHALAMEYIARLLRHTCRANGPLEIFPPGRTPDPDNVYQYLDRKAVEEFQAVLSGSPLPDDDDHGSSDVTTQPTSPTLFTGGTFTPDSVSAKHITTLEPKVQQMALEWMEKCFAAGFPVRITGGSRTFAEQNELFARGRTKPGKKVTNARGGQSNHNFKIAWDFGVLRSNGSVDMDDSPRIKQAAIIAEGIGLEWGGRWTRFVDENHLQYRTRLSLGDMQARFAARGSVL